MKLIASALFLALVGLAGCRSQAATHPTDQTKSVEKVAPAREGAGLPRAAATQPASFDRLGTKVGQQLPDVAVYTLDKEERPLASLCNRPTLLLSSSFTCPKSRSTWPQADKIAAEYKDQIDVAILYVIEAHPFGDICPYQGVEDVTEQNRRDNILRRQPRTLEERIKLAREFQARLHIGVPIYVDAMSNDAWQAVGGGPNMGILLNDAAIVVQRQGWFDPPAMRRMIDGLLKEEAEQKKQRDALERKRKEAEAVLEARGHSGYSADEAFIKGKIDEVTDLLREHPELVSTYYYNGGKPNFRDGWSLLQTAVNANQPEVVKLLVEHGADVNAMSPAGITALHVASDPRMIKFLLEHKAQINRKNARGLTALDLALQNGNLEGANVLLAGGAQEDVSTDAGLGKVDSIRERIGADGTEVNRPDGLGHSPLFYAVANNQREMVKFLLSHGARAGAPKESRYPAVLEGAIENKNSVVVNLLLDAGANPNMGWRLPLNQAVIQGDKRIVEALLAHGANVKATDSSGTTALHDAASTGKIEMMEILVKAGAPVESRSKADGSGCGPPDPVADSTPLHSAAAGGQIEAAQWLVAHRADVNAIDNHRHTPLRSAVEHFDDGKNLPMIEFLLESKASINAEDKDGETVLDAAGNDEKLAEFLRKRGAKPGSREEHPVKNRSDGLFH
jgi:ankyrin repeat protein